MDGCMGATRPPDRGAVRRPGTAEAGTGWTTVAVAVAEAPAVPVEAIAGAEPVPGAEGRGGRPAMDAGTAAVAGAVAPLAPAGAPVPAGARAAGDWALGAASVVDVVTVTAGDALRAVASVPAAGSEASRRARRAANEPPVPPDDDDEEEVVVAMPPAVTVAAAVMGPVVPVLLAVGLEGEEDVTCTCVRAEARTGTGKAPELALPALPAPALAVYRAGDGDVAALS